MALAGVHKITLVNRSETRGRELETLFRTDLNDAVGGALEINYETWDAPFIVPEDTDILVNATSIGLFPDGDAEIPLALESLPPSTIVADVIPNPPETLLVRAARDAGISVSFP